MTRAEQALSVLQDISAEDEDEDVSDEDEDVSDALASAAEAIKTRKEQRQREAPIPADVKNRVEWCAENGGHNINGFCEYWRCERCGLDGYD